MVNEFHVVKHTHSMVPRQRFRDFDVSDGNQIPSVFVCRSKAKASGFSFPERTLSKRALAC